ncbi:hypothetical protein Lal_00022745 [Lupinus albus]|nr:hypothetical protein Lal_00022745 [Lupinus albus]
MISEPEPNFFPIVMGQNMSFSYGSKVTVRLAKEQPSSSSSSMGKGTTIFIFIFIFSVHLPLLWANKQLSSNILLYLQSRKDLVITSNMNVASTEHVSQGSSHQVSVENTSNPTLEPSQSHVGQDDITE